MGIERWLEIGLKRPLYLIIVQSQSGIIVHPRGVVIHVATPLYHFVGHGSQHGGYITRLTSLTSAVYVSSLVVID